MTENKPNLELLQKVVDKIAKFEDDFIAETLFSSETTVEYESRTFWQKITDYLTITSPKINKETTTYEGNVAFWVVKLGGSDPMSCNILWEAQKLLNINSQQARSLFTPHWYPLEFRNLYKACKENSEWAEWIVIQRLQHFIDCGGIESSEE